jgi:hypothetical protein
VSKPFTSTHPHASPEKFPSALFLNFSQAIASCLSAVVYLLARSWKDGSLKAKGLTGVLGINQLSSRSNAGPEGKALEKTAIANGHGSDKSDTRAQNGSTPASDLTTLTTTSIARSLPLLLFQVSMFQTMAGPIGFSALRHISYPTMVLGKVCCICSSLHSLYLALPKIDHGYLQLHVDPFSNLQNYQGTMLTPSSHASLFRSSFSTSSYIDAVSHPTNTSLSRSSPLVYRCSCSLDLQRRRVDKIVHGA